MTRTGSMDGVSLTGLQEEAMALALDMLVEAVLEGQGSLGDTPFGWQEATVWEQLHQWLLIRDDPEAIRALLTDWMQTLPPAVVEAQAIREATRLELLLARKGGWEGTARDLVDLQPADAQAFAFYIREGIQAVRRYWEIDAAQKARRINDTLDTLAAKPQALITPAVPPSELDALLNQSSPPVMGGSSVPLPASAGVMPGGMSLLPPPALPGGS